MVFQSRKIKLPQIFFHKNLLHCGDYTTLFPGSLFFPGNEVGNYIQKNVSVYLTSLSSRCKTVNLQTKRSEIKKNMIANN